MWIKIILLFKFKLKLKYYNTKVIVVNKKIFYYVSCKAVNTTKLGMHIYLL